MLTVSQNAANFADRDADRVLRSGWWNETTFYGNETMHSLNGWQYDDVFIEEEWFLDLVRFGVASMYHRGSLDRDVN
jgi:hypothetical protein